MNESVLITGGCGFVGSNMAIKLKTDFPKMRIVALDNLKRRGSELNIPRLQECGVEFVHGDVRNKEDFKNIGNITLLIDAAAEPSVLSGIDSSPDYVINTNLAGTLNCLQFAQSNNARFLFLSTSRVYPISNLSAIKYDISETRFNICKEQDLDGVSGQGIAENFNLNGARSFYGSSKLASELFIQEYAEFYGLKTIINRCGVITGPWQMGKVDQGVVVLWLANHFWKKKLSYIGFEGSGKQVRDILHIDDLYRLVKLQILSFDHYASDIYNVGGGNESSLSLLEMTAICEEVTGNKIPISAVKEERLADIPLYITDNSKINLISGWKPEMKPIDIFKDIYIWMVENESLIKKILN